MSLAPLAAHALEHFWRLQGEALIQAELERRQFARPWHFQPVVPNASVPVQHVPTHQSEPILPSPPLQGHWQINRARTTRPPPKRSSSGYKLTAETVIAIRAARASGRTLSDVAHEFHISKTYVRDLASRKRWAHVA